MNWELWSNLFDPMPNKTELVVGLVCPRREYDPNIWVSRIKNKVLKLFHKRNKKKLGNIH